MIRCVKTKALAIFAGIAAVSGPPSAAVSMWIPASDAYEDGLMLGDDGATPLLPNYSRRADNSDWLKLENDVCGMLERVDSRRSMIFQSSVSDLYDFDEDDPATEAHTVFGQWLSAHAEIAVVTDGVDRSCEDYRFDGDDFPPETIA
jgi:hypothetical protein